MKNSVPLLADFIKFSSKSNGRRFQPSLNARMRYGARLKHAVQLAEDEIMHSLRLTSVRRGRNGLRFVD